MGCYKLDSEVLSYMKLTFFLKMSPKHCENTGEMLGERMLLKGSFRGLKREQRGFGADFRSGYFPKIAAKVWIYNSESCSAEGLLE